MCSPSRHAALTAAARNPDAPPLATAGLLAGTRYRLLRPIAAGGMGELYAAWHVDRREVHALKLLPRRLARHREIVRRMALEAEALRRVRHPRVVRLLGCGELADGRPFLALELLAGESLRQRLERSGALTTADATRWLLQLLAALDAAHRAGVAHGDVKPGNLIIGPSGDLTLIDFGAAELGRVGSGPAPAAHARERVPPAPFEPTGPAGTGERAAAATRVERRSWAASRAPASRGAPASKPMGPGLRRCGSDRLRTGTRAGRFGTGSSAPSRCRSLPEPARWLVGTPKYMSPARKAGAAPCPQSDLFAAGLLLRELALRVAAHGPAGLRPWVVRTLAIARRACAVDAGSPFATAPQMARALRQLAGLFCSRRWRSCFSRQAARRRSRRRRVRLRELEFCGMRELIAQLPCRANGRGGRRRPRAEPPRSKQCARKATACIVPW